MSNEGKLHELLNEGQALQNRLELRVEKKKRRSYRKTIQKVQQARHCLLQIIEGECLVQKSLVTRAWIFGNKGMDLW